jgi:hypothetical protein
MPVDALWRIKVCEKFHQGKCADCFTHFGYCYCDLGRNITLNALEHLQLGKNKKPGDSQDPRPDHI